MAVFDREDETITTYLTWRNLTGPAGQTHIHSEPAGVPFNVNTRPGLEHELLFTGKSGFIPPTVSTDCPPGSGICLPATGVLTNVYEVPTRVDPNSPNSNFASYNCDFEALVNIALSSDFYIDMHTTAFPDGEIRGQLHPVTEFSTLN